jgi:multiple sugar transport system permease protein
MSEGAHEISARPLFLQTDIWTEGIIMKRKMTFKQFLFILPLLVIIAVFSIWPILTSFSYTFFDYQLNNVQKSKLSFSGSFNAKTFQENSEYVKIFLTDDAAIAANNKTAANNFAAVLANAQSYEKEFAGIPTGKLTAAQSDAFQKKTASLKTEVNALYQKYPNEAFENRKNLPMIFQEISKAVEPSNFIGLSGYQKILGDTRLFSSLWHTLFFTIVSVFFEFVAGLGLALIMNKAIRGIGIIRTGALIPWAIPTAVSALMWSYLYDGSSGIISHIFAALGFIPSPEHMLLSGMGAMSAAILTDIWKTTPYMALLLLAGLQVIDRGLYESSAIDGAGKIQTFFKITLPLLKPSILVAVLFRTLDAFRVYDLIAVLTGGGPGGSTETLSIYAYKTMFSQTNFGYGSIIVMFMFVCVLIIAALFVKVLGANVISTD